MKTKTLLIILLFFFIGYGFSQQIPQSPNKIDKNGFREGKWTILYNKNGNETKNPDSVHKYRMLTFSYGKPAGTVKEYDTSGKIRFEGKLKSLNPDVYQGLCTWYYENGKVKTYGYFKNGKGDSLLCGFYPNGKLFLKGIFRNGMIWNVLEIYDSLGNPLPIGNMKNGTGYYINYNILGEKVGEGNLLNGEYDGKWKEYSYIESCEGNYIHGKKEGKWFCRFKNNNNLSEEGWFVNGQRDSLYKEYFEDGSIKTLGVYKKGNKEGFWKEIYEDRSRFEGNYINNQREGTWIRYYSNGDKQFEIKFKRGVGTLFFDMKMKNK